MSNHITKVRMKVCTAAVITIFAMIAVPSSAEGAAEKSTPEWNVSLGYTADYWRNFAGGLRTDDVFIGLTALGVDWKSASGGLRSKVQVIHSNGNSFAEIVGETNVISNIEADRATRLLEAWLEYAPEDDDRSVKLGLYDLNSEFDVSEVGGALINSTFGIGVDFAQSGVSGPAIFPWGGLAVRGRWRFDDRWMLQSALIDGAPADPNSPRKFASVDIDSDQGALWVTELEHRTALWRAVVGHWRYSTKFEEFDGLADGSSKKSRQNSGTYGLIEGPIRQFDDRRLLAVLRLGKANPQFNGIDSTIQAALVLERPWLRREGEHIAMGVAYARNGRPARRLAIAAGEALLDKETTVEVSWRVPVSERIALQPDLQYVINPGSSPDVDDALAVGLRVEFDLTIR